MKSEKLVQLQFALVTAVLLTVVGYALQTRAASQTNAANLAPVQTAPRVKALRVQVLSTMLADAGIGEWGFAALVEADGKQILFDTGARPETVLQNAKELGVNLAEVREVILSHNHDDHTGGLLTLRRELRKQNPQALSIAHVGRGIFWKRQGGNSNPGGDWMLRVKRDYEALGGRFVEYREPKALLPGVWLTGPVPRAYPERNWSGAGKVEAPEGQAHWIEDNLPEDQSLVIDTEQGLVVVSGCGHAGIINTLEYARQKVRNAPIHLALGGFHLFAANDEKLDWTAGKLKEFGLQQFLGGHCTGIEAVYRLRERAGLKRQTAMVAAVGASFTLGKGIDPRSLAR